MQPSKMFPSMDIRYKNDCETEAVVRSSVHEEDRNQERPDAYVILEEGGNTNDGVGVETLDSEVDERVELIKTKECTFKQEVCTIHKIKGTKTESTTQKWTKKKFGFGFVTRKVINWKCEYSDRISDDKILGGESESHMPGLRKPEYEIEGSYICLENQFNGKDYQDYDIGATGQIIVERKVKSQNGQTETT